MGIAILVSLLVSLLASTSVGAQDIECDEGGCYQYVEGESGGEPSGEPTADSMGRGLIQALKSLAKAGYWVGYLGGKTGYAATGCTVGGLGWLFSGFDKEVANRVIHPAIHGTWILTPEMLALEKPPKFFGGRPGNKPPMVMRRVRVEQPARTEKETVPGQDAGPE